MIDDTAAPTMPASPGMLPRIIFLLCLLVSASGLVSPPVALAMGLVFGLALPHPYGNEAKKFSKFLLQASVVGLGFGMNLHQVVRPGAAASSTPCSASVSLCSRAWASERC